jgi:hypothetical protein
VNDLSDLTPEVVAWIRREMKMRGIAGPERIKWGDPAPLTAEETALFAPLWPPRHAGPPKSFEEMAARAAADDDLWSREKARITAVGGLGVQKVSQHAADAAYSDPSEPRWIVRVVPVGKMSDNGLPPLVLRAESPYQAKERYAVVCGLTGGAEMGVDPHGHEWQITPYVAGPAPAAPPAA